MVVVEEEEGGENDKVATSHDLLPHTGGLGRLARRANMEGRDEKGRWRRNLIAGEDFTIAHFEVAPALTGGAGAVAE